MKPLDRFLQAWRISQARKWVQKQGRLLDIGCNKGEFLCAMGGHIAPSVGLEPTLSEPIYLHPHTLLEGNFPNGTLDDNSFDTISMLAVLEHVPANDLTACVAECYRVLKPGGRVIITVPSTWVDSILRLLVWLRLVDGMCFHEHYGFQPDQVYQLFHPPQFILLCHRRFQLGLNNLFVFEKPS